jgi:radical SAM superfamily enzyme YgiQ (UPF0313 family)
MNILLVSPRTPSTFWSFRHAVSFMSREASSPPLGLLTVAAMLPRSWNLKLVDLDARSLEDESILWADYVLIGGMIVHRDSATEVAKRCRALGRPVIAGGPLFAAGHESFPEIDHFVLGEAEDLIEKLVEDMTEGRVAPIYEATGFPELSRTPVPRWDLIRLRDYASMSIQFSRGCPFNCEFCDIVAMNGRVPRTKAPQQIIDELEALRRAGWKGRVFLVDDNFIGNRRKVKELLRAMIAWRRSTRVWMEFLTEASVNLAADVELLGLMAEAGFKQVFLGIETPSLEGLAECGKKQNLAAGDLATSVRTIQEAGIEVMGGFILGFDSDPPDIFERQFEFIQKSGIVTAMVGILTALPRTRLYQRLVAEKRLVAVSTGNNTEAVCNFIPRLGQETLTDGYRRLVRSLYEPGAFYARARELLAHHRPQGPRTHISMGHVKALFRSFWKLGVRQSGRREYWKFLGHTLVHEPQAFAMAVTLAIYGHHFRMVAGTL